MTSMIPHHRSSYYQLFRGPFVTGLILCTFLLSYLQHQQPQQRLMLVFYMIQFNLLVLAIVLSLYDIYQLFLRYMQTLLQKIIQSIVLDDVLFHMFNYNPLLSGILPTIIGTIVGNIMIYTLPTTPEQRIQLFQSALDGWIGPTQVQHILQEPGGIISLFPASFQIWLGKQPTTKVSTAPSSALIAASVVISAADQSTTKQKPYHHDQDERYLLRRGEVLGSDRMQKHNHDDVMSTESSSSETSSNAGSSYSPTALEKSGVVDPNHDNSTTVPYRYSHRQRLCLNRSEQENYNGNTIWVDPLACPANQQSNHRIHTYQEQTDHVSHESFKVALDETNDSTATTTTTVIKSVPLMHEVVLSILNAYIQRHIHQFIQAIPTRSVSMISLTTATILWIQIRSMIWKHKSSSPHNDRFQQHTRDEGLLLWSLLRATTSACNIGVFVTSTALLVTKYYYTTNALGDKDAELINHAHDTPMSSMAAGWPTRATWRNISPTCIWKLIKVHIQKQSGWSKWQGIVAAMILLYYRRQKTNHSTIK